MKFLMLGEAQGVNNRGKGVGRRGDRKREKGERRREKTESETVRDDVWQRREKGR